VKSRRPVVAGVTVLALSLAPLALAGATSTTTTTAGSTTGGPTTTTSRPPSTYLGPDGVVSTAIQAENRRAGTTSWRIGANTSVTAIQGFANVTYASAGQTVTLRVTTRLAQYRVVAYRMGYYQGRGAREVWSSGLVTGQNQPACSLAPSTNMVSCANWAPSLSVPITAAFVPGDYLFKLVAGPRAASYVPLTVWDPASRATYVIMNRSLVEQGWNTYGGYSYYAGLGPCILDTSSYPPCNRARVVSFDRPYATGSGSSDFLTNEYPLIRTAEKEGLDVTYITDITLDEHPTLLVSHRALLSLDHDETWTYQERAAVQSAVAHGVNVVYFGAAAMVRHARLEPSVLGPDRQEVDYRNGAEDPLVATGPPLQVTGNTWEDPPADWSPVSQIGEEYVGYLAPGQYASMVVSDAGSWLYRGTGLHSGSLIPGVIASDIDRVIPSAANPPNLEVLSHSPVPVGSGTFSSTTWGGYTYADFVYFTDPHSQAGVVDTGNNVWIGDLRPCPASNPSCPAPVMTAMTNNILRLVGRGPAGRYEPARSNLASVSPAGS
jgi:N,N-dimethylformamidase beta subunit-like, C-terminal